MEPFKVIKSKAIPIDMINVDTDQIIPKQFLKLVSRTGFGNYLFYDWRFDKDGKPKSKFVLNNPKYAQRQILLTRDNFGSGSSREHAVWAIQDYGFKVIIGSSFADIFYNNCFKNGILPITLKHEEIDYLFSRSEDIEIEVELVNQRVIAGSEVIRFEIDDFRKKNLIEGLDDIQMTLQLESEIAQYERESKCLSLDNI